MKKRKNKFRKWLDRLTTFNLILVLFPMIAIFLFVSIASTTIFYKFYLDRMEDMAVNKKTELLSDFRREYINFQDELLDPLSPPTEQTIPGAIINGVIDKNTKDMVADYLNAIHLASNTGSVKVPPWFIIGLNIMEGGGFYSQKKPLPSTDLKLEKYGQNRDDGSVINFVTWGIEDSKKYGSNSASNWDGAGVKGPFKIQQSNWDGGWAADGNKDGKSDVFNLYDSATATAIRHAKDYESAKKLLGNPANDDIVWMYLASAHNAGPAGIRWRIPNDMIPEYSEQMNKSTKETALGDEIYQNFFDIGRGWKFRTSVFKIYDKYGWAFNQSIINKLVNFTPSKPASATVKDWPANSKGERPGQGQGNPGSQTLTYGTAGKNMAHNVESGEYHLAVYHLGTRTYKLLMAMAGSSVGEEVKGGMTANGGSSVSYHWEKQGKTAPDPKVEGKSNEVGYKGNFALYVQSYSTNQISKTPWKFKGSSTNLGNAGCSLYAITSLIHGAGYGSLPIPNSKNGTNGLKDGVINITELAKALPNGPLLNVHLSQLGYQTKSISLATKEGREQFFEELKEGIPYVVNTKSGLVKGFTYDGTPINTKFTNGGHFVLFVGAFEKDGKRYVEVVQSTHSQAGKTNPDQNKAYFDYDSLIENGIMRSSGGSYVPVYTIVGYPGQKPPLYLQAGYVPPIYPNRNSVTQTTNPNPNISLDQDNLNTPVEDILTLEELSNNLFGNSIQNGKLNKDVNVILPTLSVVEVKPTLIRIFITKKDFLEISKIKPTISRTSIYEKGTNVGTALEGAEIKTGFLDGSNYIYLDYEELNVTED